MFDHVKRTIQLQIAVYIRIKPWKSPILLTYFNILHYDVIASLGAVSMYSVKLYLYKHPGTGSPSLEDFRNAIYGTGNI